MQLLTRNDFRERALKRDQGRCVLCGEPATAVHHIIERALFDDGGYYLDNAASLCERHHLEAEHTTLSCEAIREAVGIATVVLPEQLACSNNDLYDKWGNLYFRNGRKFRGELWYEESCQKALAAGGVLGEFSKFTPYPRSYHLPWSPELQNDDRRIHSLQHLEGREVVATLKMDGEGASLYAHGCHARSLDFRHHDSRSWIKRYHATLAHEIPEDWRLCGENMYAQHTLAYYELESFFLLFNFWNRNTCLSWDDTAAYAAMLNVPMVKTLYRGPWDEKILRQLGKEMDPSIHEGYVVRVTDAIKMSDWRHCAAKYVRKGHVGTSGHWMHRKVVPNRLREGVPCLT